QRIEQSVAYDGTTQSESALKPIHVGLREVGNGALKVRDRDQVPVLDEPERGSMRLVRSPLRHDAHDVRGAACVLGVVWIEQDVIFLQRVDRNDRPIRR